MTSSTTVLCLVGPTASGKSNAVSVLAKRWPIEVINVNSGTIYKGMDIGTAKPPVKERNLVKQHLLDILDPSQTYCVAQFCLDALRLIDSIHKKKHIPVLVGGTMMYFQALRQGLCLLPPANQKIRTDFNKRAILEGWSSLHEELMRLDPITASRIYPNDTQRIQRALEICMLSSRPMSSLLKENQPIQTSKKYRYVTLSLEPSDRLCLYKRIARRFTSMMDAGFLDEVKDLHARGDLHTDLPSIRCIGYRQLWGYLDAEIDLGTAESKAIAATRRLAKRQLTWLKTMPNRIVVDCLEKTVDLQIVDIFSELYSDT